MHHFQTPVVDEPGQDLPLILGLRSMRSKDGVLEMAAGKERLTFPGAGGYSIQWMPGAQHFPLVPAPSGHLILPCGEYQKIQKHGGLQRTTTTFHATPSRGCPEVQDGDKVWVDCAMESRTVVSRPDEVGTSSHSASSSL